MNPPVNTIIWNMTRKCNFRCDYCYFPHDNTPVTETLDANRIKEVLDSTGQTWKIGLTGGEPFIYPDFVDVCETLTSSHVIGIDTNLSIPSKVKEFARRIDPKRVHNLYVALHIEERERLKGVEAFIRNARLLIDSGFTIIVNYVVHPNLEKRFHIDRKFYASHGIVITPRPFRGEFNGRRYPEAYGERARDIFLDHPEQGKKVAFNFYDVPCTAGKTLLRMEADGTIFRCPGDKTVLGNILDTVNFLQKAEPCIKKRCPCQGLAHVQLSPAQKHLVDGVQYAVVAENITSRTSFEAAMEADPGHPCAENNLGVLDWRKGDFANAIAHFKTALECMPENERYARNLAGAQAGDQNFDPEICLDVNPDLS
ncbi:radical SAM protein [Pseudodesulfovibrio sediminis]|uniref:Radical SAM core domain-containing protein n=1 Tax=Pseudodesulfovibrio sediminis TaxID=2810563 RepID=A0ABM7P725_9BACT|nr:radical SAM protein [Pseudodesulfovibrio sediminis]BCS88756.1 hypothetical protein PSDVSF_19980 [Pseudodesulfovibrio sediminis]